MQAGVEDHKCTARIVSEIGCNDCHTSIEVVDDIVIVILFVSAAIRMHIAKTGTNAARLSSTQCNARIDNVVVEVGIVTVFKIFMNIVKAKCT